MKRGIFIVLAFGIVIQQFQVLAQTDPGTENLMHQWTFDDGTAGDAVTANPVSGILMGGASIVDNALRLSANGQYLAFPASSLAMNTYPVITQEIWFTSVEGANTGYTMLSYFGGTNGTLGYNYVSTSVARGDDVSRTAITNGTYDSEISADGPEYDDGVLHHMVSIISQDSVILYIDGEKISATPNTIAISSIQNSLAYLGKGGYSDDRTWIGTISMFSIYNRVLTSGEVKYLYNKGAEQSPLIITSGDSFSFDDLYTTDVLAVSGFNLTDSIRITVPEGITVSMSVLGPDVKDLSIFVSYDGITPVDGNIVLASGEFEKIIGVKSYTNDCYTPLYDGIPNLIADPWLSSLDAFNGWGDRKINTDPGYVYCGATSGMISGSNSGSIDVILTGELLPNTRYRVKAKVLTIGGSFQVGMFGWSAGQPDINYRFITNGSWDDLDVIFTTGSVLASTQGIFFNNYDLSGITGYIDNWECYAIPKVYASLPSLDFITPSSKTVNIRGVNLGSTITISAPDGFIVSPETMSPGVNGEILTIEFIGPGTASGYVYFTSGVVKDSLFVSGSTEPLLLTSVGQIVLDEISNSASFEVSGFNLSDDVILSVPGGITLSEYTLPDPVSEASIEVTYDGIGNSSGNIKMTSGAYTLNLPLQASRNDECFTPLYNDRKNLITDPTCNTYVTDGWGGRGINDDPAFTYCGARSGKVTGNGSLERDLTGILKPNTTYRVKARVYKRSSVQYGNMGNVTYTLAMDSMAYPQAYQLIKIAMDSACYYFNKYTPFIQDVYVYYSPGIPTAQASYHGSLGFGPNTRYMWVGTAIHEMAHYFGSGTTSLWQSKMASGTWSGTVANDLMESLSGGPIYGDSQHYWPYGINQKEEITNLGSQSVQEKALADAVKLIRAMLVDDCGLPTNNPPVGVGIYGWDAASGDIYHEVNLTNSWQDIDFTFTTGETLKSSQRIYFNNGVGYIDNWEMYDISSSTGIADVKLLEFSVFAADDLLTVKFDLAEESMVTIAVYDIQGKHVINHSYRGHTGLNTESIVVQQPDGIYLIRVTTAKGFTGTKKIILFHSK